MGGERQATAGARGAARTGAKAVAKAGTKRGPGAEAKASAKRTAGVEAKAAAKRGANPEAKPGASRGRTAGQLELFARCAGGFEEVLGQELRDLAMRRVRPQVGGVIFFGTLEDAYRACLWSRVATRIQLVVARVPATDAQALYQGVYDIAWEKLVRPGATVAVDAHGENPELRNTQFTALKVKDALCDRLREVRGVRPDVDAKDPGLQVNVAVHPRKATVYLNLSGASLHRRGYRTDGVQTEAPLKETLAAGILLAAGWSDVSEAEGCLADPMCGSGTFAIEAALMAANIAPGLLRKKWGFEGWLGHDPALWESVRSDAECQRRWAVGAPRILAADLDAHAVQIARANAERAGVADEIRFFVDDAARLGRHLRVLPGYREAVGLLVCNPPYGLRLLSGEQLPQVRTALAAAVDSLPRGWRVALISPDEAMDSALGRVPERAITCHNGPISTWVRLYRTDGRPLEAELTSLAGKTRRVRVAERTSAQFAARLRKAAKERLRWAAGEQVSCLRLYDADLPDYALSLDLYEGAGDDEGTRVAVLSERRRPASVDQQRASRRLADAALLAAAVLDLSPSDVVVRPWQESARARRAKTEEVHRYLTVAERGTLLRLDLARPEDVLPLGQRGVRDLAALLASKARVAGLFATSGATLMRAARAGARSAVLVDASQDWLDGARRMLDANGSQGRACRCLRKDVRAWLQDEAKAHRSYDLLLCVAPTWLPAQAAGGREWSLERDGSLLVRMAVRLLSRRGVLLLCFEGPALELDPTDVAGVTVRDMSAELRPADFERSRPTLRCWKVSKD